VSVPARPVLESSVMRPCVAPLVGLDMSPVAPIGHTEPVAAMSDLSPAARRYRADPLTWELVGEFAHENVVISASGYPHVRGHLCAGSRNQPTQNKENAHGQATQR
jgi:hypothetical protein